MDDLLMIVPTRGRPGSVSAVLDCWLKTEATADLIFAVDDDDPMLPGYRDHMESINDPRIRWYIGPRLRLCGTLNAVAVSEAPHYKFLAFMGDDNRPRTRGWDARFRRCLSEGPGIVYGNDLLQGEAMATTVAMTSDIVRTLGYMAPPAFIHLCIDLVWVDWGRGMGRITYLDDVILEHMHPANGKAESDDSYAESNSIKTLTTDSATYYNYRDNGGLQSDLEKLRMLVDQAG
ncbi:glycosyltransferase family 2 protein [Streptomyces goshikiensis]|uniref:glycosyltransferase family 2 protein n=1 Tax=Streptomyces goshikiensis TaxID=1942 RepID=UPI0036CFE13A